MKEQWEIEATKPVTAEIDAASLCSIKDVIHPVNRFHDEDGNFILWAHDLTSGISQRVLLKRKP